uniref:DUF2116 family Zn-ribbon domain-containing protein n=1 Tax=Strongyloides papillosus TaxID=174720 RepID=A0A0N5CC19_STREA
MSCVPRGNFQDPSNLCRTMCDEQYDSNDIIRDFFVGLFGICLPYLIQLVLYCWKKYHEQKNNQSADSQNDQVEAAAGQSAGDPLVTSNEAANQQVSTANEYVEAFYEQVEAVDDQAKTFKYQDMASGDKYRTSKSSNTSVSNTVTSKNNIYYIPFSDEVDY